MIDTITITTTEYKELVRKTTLLDVIAAQAAKDQYISTSLVEQLLRPMPEVKSEITEQKTDDEPNF
jgi:phage pi2 protein 07